MLILLSYPVAAEDRNAVLAGNVLYRPDLEREQPDVVGRALARLRPDALLIRAPLHPAAAAPWRAAMPGVPLLAIATAPAIAGDPVLEALDITCRAVRGAVAALALAERVWTEKVTAAEVPGRLARSRALGGRSATLVGGGIVNLMTALRLSREGYEVAVYDAAPEWRPDVEWTEYGCTHGGDNARMFTLTEADNYNDQSDLFLRPVSKGGWRIRDARSIPPKEQLWAEEFERVPPWLAHTYNEDTFLFNREASGLWQELMAAEPTLFDGVGLREGILRLYTDPEHFRAQVARQDRVGATRRVLEPDEIAERHPALEQACAAALLAGGIEVVGFTVQIHDFVVRLVGLLERAGVRLHWGRQVSGISWDRDGTVAGLVTPEGVVTSDHYVLSPGAYGGDLLHGTASEDKIHGVLGVWLTIPNLEPGLRQSLKIARRGHLAEDSNVTVARDRQGDPTLIIGSGYGWTGANPLNIDAAELETLYRAVEDTARRFFPRAHAAARESGLLQMGRRLCVRPWTSSSLGVLEIIQARGGALVVTGGHNTGGFTQAPAVAAAVAAALRGDPHPMHTLYHPQRLRRFTEPAPAGSTDGLTTR